MPKWISSLVALQRLTRLGVLGLVGGAAVGLGAQGYVVIDDRESDLYVSIYHELNPLTLSGPLSAYNGSGADYWAGVSAPKTAPANAFNYSQGNGAPVRSPWTVTTSHSTNQFSFTASGQVSRLIDYGVITTNEYGDKFEVYGEQQVPYTLNLSFEEILTDNNSAGRTGIAGRITSLTGSVQYSTAGTTRTGYEFANLGLLGYLGNSDSVQGYYGNDSNPEAPSSGTISLSLDTVTYAPSMYDVYFNESLPNNSPSVNLGGIETWIQAGGQVGETTTNAAISVQGNFSYTFEAANAQGEFIFTGTDSLARDYFNPENWSQRMTPGVVDHVQFKHADNKEVDFGYYGYGGIEDNRSLHVSDGGTTIVDLGVVSYPLSWRLGKNFDDIEDLALKIDTGKLAIKGGLLEIVGSATLARTSGQVAVLEVDAGGHVKFTNRERVITSTLSEFEPSILKIGDQGQGTLNIKNAGKLTADIISVAVASGSTGNVVVTGAGSKLQAAALVAGQLGQAEFIVQNGSSVTLGTFAVAVGAGSQGEITVRNTGSEILMETGSLVGGEGGGRGRLEVLEGGKLQGSLDAGISVILGIGGGNPAQPSTVLVSGAGSTLSNVGSIVRAGGLLQIRDGASWVSGGGANRLLVSGGEAIFQNTETVTLESIEVNKAFDNSGGPNQGELIATGRLNVLSGAVVNVSNLLSIGAGAQVNVNGTGARIEGLESGRIYGSLNVSNGGQVLAGPLGRIIVENGGVISGSGGVIAFQPRTDESGEFIPYVQVQAGGTIRPGNSPGTLTINGDVVFEAGSHLQLEIGGLTAGSLYDQLVVSGNASFAEGSIVEFAFTNGFAPTAGQTFSFFDVGGTLNFNTALASFSVIGLETGWDYETSVIDGGFALKSLSNGIATTTVSAIPEPSTYAVIAGGLVLAGACFRRRSRATAKT